MSADPYERIEAIGAQLIEVHDRLREQLAGVRADAHAARPDLRSHCLAFCAAVGAHHGAEDAGLFPALAARFPHLRPVVDELRRDHEVMAGLLGRVADGATPDEIEGLAAILESHLGYEERKLMAFLCELDPPADAAWL